MSDEAVMSRKRERFHRCQHGYPRKSCGKVARGRYEAVSWRLGTTGLWWLCEEHAPKEEEGRIRA